MYQAVFEMPFPVLPSKSLSKITQVTGLGFEPRQWCDPKAQAQPHARQRLISALYKTTS